MRVAVLIAFLTLAGNAAAESLPTWASAPMAEPVPVSMSDAPAVDLLREEIVAFDGSDRVVDTSRKVIRIVTKEGRDQASVVAGYSTRGDKVRSLRAWIQSPTGTIREVDHGRVIDAAVVNEDLYNEARVRILSAGEGIEPGSVFISESVVEVVTPFTQFRSWFQGRDPVLRSRFRLLAPAGWDVRATSFHHEPIPTPARDGEGWTWELADLPGLPEEPDAADLEEMASGIGVALVPPKQGDHAGPPSFGTWEDVSDWLASLSDPQATVTPAIADRARALVPATASEPEKVRAIARYVQEINYVAIQMGLDRGGGYRPHEASDVLAKSYGDCKDKANLMRALLRADGIESYLVVLSVGDPAGVAADWPSPFQFDHCIIGVKVAGRDDRCTISVPQLGALTLFDPTDPNTPWGDLPSPERGTVVLVVAPSHGGTAQTPADRPSRNRSERRIDAELLATGDLRGTFREFSTGSAATEERSARRNLRSADYAQWLASRFGGIVGGVAIDSASAEDAGLDSFVVHGSFRIERFARPMGGFLMLRPAVAAPVPIGEGWARNRSCPIRLKLRQWTETVHLRLPPPFALDEVPAPVALEASFASYRCTIGSHAGLVTFERSLELKSSEIQPVAIDDARRFFDSVRGTELVQVLVKR